MASPIPLVGGHPRLLIRPGQLAAFRRDSLGHRRADRRDLLHRLEPLLASSTALREGFGQHPERVALGLGQAWRLTGDVRYGQAAHWLLRSIEFAAATRPTGYDTWGIMAETAAMLYDWLHDWWRREGLLATCATITAYCAQRAMTDSLRLYILDDWHNYRLGLQAGALAAALALGDEWPELEDGSVLRRLHACHFTGLRSDGRFVQDAYEGGPQVHCLQTALERQGYAMHAEAAGAYHEVDAFEAVKIAALWTSALQPAFRRHRPVWPELERAGEALLSLLCPDGRNAVLGDAAPRPPQHWGVNALLHLQARSRRSDFAEYLRRHGGAACQDPLPVHRLLCSLPRTARLRRSAAPAAALFDPVAVLRAGRGRDATMITFRCGRYGGWHNHLDGNSFTIQRGSRLAVDSGSVDYGGTSRMEYGARTIAHNAILVRDPAERHWGGKLGVPIANDGGQRPVMVSYAPPNRASGEPHALLTEGNRSAQADEFDTGRYLAFRAGRRLDYLAGDATRAYTYPWSGIGDNPSRRVEEAVRQLVFLKPDLVVVIDRVEASRAGLEKRWLLHTVAPPGGPTARTLAPGIHDLAGREFEFRHGRGRLTVWPAMPGPCRIRAIGGAGYECWVDGPDGGSNHIASRVHAESGSWRLEIEPLGESLRHCFAVVMHAGLASQPRAAGRYRCSSTEAGGHLRVVIERRTRGGWRQHAVVRCRTAGEVTAEIAYAGADFADRARAPERVPRAG